MKILLLLAAVAGAQPQQFDLVCTGTTKVTTAGQVRSEPFAETYRVDLGANKWCEGGCGEIEDIHSVQPALLELWAPRRTDTFADRTTVDGFISRTTGEMQTLRSIGRGLDLMMWETHAQCEPAPFSGFPRIATKF